MNHIKTLVVDNSVILKPLLREEGAEIVEKMFLLKDKFELSILVPDIFRYEFFNKVTREYDAQIAQVAWNNLTERQVSIIPLEYDIITASNKLMKKYSKISFYDAAYHALAKVYRVDFITADKKYYQLTKAEGDVKLLEELHLK